MTKLHFPYLNFLFDVSHMNFNEIKIISSMIYFHFFKTYLFHLKFFIFDHFYSNLKDTPNHAVIAFLHFLLHFFLAKSHLLQEISRHSLSYLIF